ncbi:MAG TPA: energy transducer TonB [Rubricoccaceae bacterium]|nr:energy transducer TonB [Rubricoccaceae bacterium]
MNALVLAGCVAVEPAAVQGSPMPPPYDPALDSVGPIYETAEVDLPPYPPYDAARLIDAAYPDFARRAGIEGRVVVRALVSPRGVVEKVERVSGVHELLDQAALETVRTFWFTPGELDGQHGRVWTSYTAVFALE